MHAQAQAPTGSDAYAVRNHEAMMERRLEGVTEAGE